MVENYQSAIEVVPYTEYQKLSVSETQAKLQLRHLVITGVPTEQADMPIRFDEAGLQELTNLDSKIQIQGESSSVTGPVFFSFFFYIIHVQINRFQLSTAI
jgi:hypothetical protein